MYQVRNILIIFFISTPLFALDTDSNATLNIVADSGVYNFKTGVDMYEGHVQVDQGSTHVTADKLVTKKNHQHKIREATAYGIQTLAHFWTQPTVNQPEIHAHATTIKLYPLEMNVSLEHNVALSQGENHFQGELIHYNSKDQIITLPASSNGHARLVYNPDKS